MQAGIRLPEQLRKAAVVAFVTGIIGAAIGELLSGVLGDKSNAGTGGAVGSVLGLIVGLLAANRMSIETARLIDRLGHALVLVAALFVTLMGIIAFVSAPELATVLALAVFVALVSYFIVRLLQRN